MGITRLLEERDLDAVDALEQVHQLHPWPKEAFKQALRLKQFCVVYEEGGTITGYGVSDSGHGRTICALSMRAANALYHLWIDTATKNGASKLWAEIEPSNAAARRRLEHFGFTAIGVRPHFYGVGKDAEVWQKLLQLNTLEPATTHS